MLCGALVAGCLSLGVGCGSDPAPDASTDTGAPTDTAADTGTPTDTGAPSDGGDASVPLFLLTVQGRLRASAPGDGGGADATAGDAGSSDAGTMDGGAPPFDPAYAQMVHNNVVGSFRTIAMAAGDLTHHVGLSQRDRSQFLGMDVWNSVDGLTMTVSNPMFVAAFGGLFAASPTVTVWRQGTGYTSYIQPATNATRIYLFVRGTLRSPGDSARMVHNGAVMATMASALAGGDVSHTVWLSTTDPAQFLAVDTWTSQDGLMAFLGDPMLASALGMLFSAVPTVTTYSPPAGWSTYGDRPAWGTP